VKQIVPYPSTPLEFDAVAVTNADVDKIDGRMRDKQRTNLVRVTSAIPTLGASEVQMARSFDHAIRELVAEESALTTPPSRWQAGAAPPSTSG
jgi:hypothetical protein